MKTFEVSENMIMWAFRYALSRKSGVVLDVVTNLQHFWSDLKPETQYQIQREIKTAIKMGGAGMDCDVKLWRRLL